MKKFLLLLVLLVAPGAVTPPVSARGLVAGPARLAQGLVAIGAEGVRHRYDGSGVAIAIIDSGIDPTHPMLGGSPDCADGAFANDKVIGGWDPGEKDPLPCDSAAHGTQVAGIVAGLVPPAPAGPGGDYVGGVAPGAKLYVLKITKANGRPGSSAYLAALEWIEAHWNDDPANPVRVVTNSNTWGRVTGSCHNSEKRYERDVQATLSRLRALGIVVFNSAGNAGYKDALQWPGCMEDVQSVGALHDRKGNVLRTSNTGALLDFFAPASPAITTAPGGGYSRFGTTSAAAAYAAGASAVIQQAAMELTGRPLAVTALLALMRRSGVMVADPLARSGLERPAINVENAVRLLKP